MEGIMKRLYLSNTERKIAGVCGGLAEFFNVDPSIVRVLFILLVVFSFGFGILAYLAMWAVIPRKPEVESRGDGI
jgi:phage shock protein C